MCNLAGDPGELVDLADRLPDRVKDLNDRLVEWQVSKPAPR